VLGACITIFGAGLGVVLGWLLFRGQVKDLDTALEKSRRRLAEHESTVTDALEAIDTQIGAILGSLGEVAGGVGDIQVGSGREQDSPQQADRRDQLKRSWIAIRDRLDTLASSHPDGRTRAKYGRISRRNYHALIEALDGDGRLAAQANDFLAANELWQHFQRGRAVPTQAQVQQMADLRAVLAPEQVAAE
jgi:hypothetical protein